MPEQQRQVMEDQGQLMREQRQLPGKLRLLNGEQSQMLRRQSQMKRLHWLMHVNQKKMFAAQSQLNDKQSKMHGKQRTKSVIFRKRQVRNLFFMKKLTKEEAAHIKIKPNGRMNRARMYLMMMNPGEVILLERADWTQRTQVPNTYCLQLGRKTGRQWTCGTAVDGSGWVIERVK